MFQLYFGTVKRPIFNAGNRVTAYYVLFDGYNEDYEDESLYYSAPNIRKGLHQYEKLKDLDPARRDVESSEAEDENPTSTATTTMQPARTKRTHYPELIDAVSKKIWVVTCIIFLHLLFCLFLRSFSYGSAFEILKRYHIWHGGSIRIMHNYSHVKWWWWWYLSQIN